MTQNITASRPSKGSRALRVALWTFAILVVLVTALYFVATSSAALKRFVLPRVSQALNAEVTATDISLSPFSQLVIRNLKVHPTGAEPLLTAPEIHLRYSLTDILRGTITVHELTVDSPTVTVIQTADGRSNLDPLVEKPSKEIKPAAPAEPAKPPALNIQLVALNNATVSRQVVLPGGERQSFVLSNINIKLSDLQNGQTAKFEFASDFKLDRTPAAGDAIAANLTAQFTCALSSDLTPTAVNGNARFAVQQAAGTFADLNQLAASLDCEVTPSEVKQLSLQFQKSGNALGRLRVSGPLGLAKQEGRLKLEIQAIDRQVLNLAGSAFGLDFGQTVLNSENDLTITSSGQQIALSGSVNGKAVSVARQSLVTPALEIIAAYDLNVNQSSKQLTVQSFSLEASRTQRPLLRGGITQPMKLDWSKTADAVEESAFSLALTDLDLAEWRALLGTNILGGRVSGRLELLAKEAGRQLEFTASAEAANLSLLAGSNRVDDAGFNFQTAGDLSGFEKLQLRPSKLTLTHRGQPAAFAEASGTTDLQTQAADLQLQLNANLVTLAALTGTPDAQITSGELAFTGRVTQDGAMPIETKAQTVTGDLRLSGFTGRYADYRFDHLETVVALDTASRNQQVDLRKFSGSLKHAGQPAGSFDATGNFNLVTQAGLLSLKLSGWNENLFRPLLAPSLGDKHLVSVALNGSLEGNFNPSVQSVLKGGVQFTNLVVRDPSGRIPATPLEARLRLDAAATKTVAEIRECLLGLTPTERAKNELQLTGRVDFTQTNAIQGGLKLTADTLDFTRYYDLFAGRPAPTTSPAPTAAPAAPAAAPTEPDPITLPLRNFTCEAAIGRLYLREVDAANFQTVCKLDGGRVQLKPFQLTLNGAPVSAAADLNLAVRGWQYDVTLDATRVPIEPLANSFSPEYRGRAKGLLLADARIKGAGITGASLQKSLTGNCSLTLTNADLQLAGRWAKMVITPIALVLGLNELTRSPLTDLDARIKMGDGKITLQQFNAVGPAFLADTAGDIPIAANLNDSPLNNWPINISLSRSLAEKARLVSADTPTNVAYVKLPTFARLGGTLGNYEAKTDKLVIAGLISKSVTGIPGLAGSKAGDILQGVGNLLTGQPATGATTNQPGTNAPAATNQTGTNAPGATNQPINLLDLFRKKE